MGYRKPGTYSYGSDGTLHSTSERQITCPIPKAQTLTFDDTIRDTSDTEPFPDLPNPANNLILARTTLLRQLDANKEKLAYAKLRSKLSYDSIHSRVMSHTGHIKEHENLNRSKVGLTKSLASINQVRQNRILGNKRKLLSQRQSSARAGSKCDQPRDELRKALKKRVEKGIADAFSCEREYGWDIVVEPPQTLGEFRDFHDPYWQMQMMSPLQPGTELTRNVITALLMLKQTFPLHYVTIDINPAAVALSLNGHPIPLSSVNVNEFNAIAKKFKPCRLLGLPCDSSERNCRRHGRCSSKNPHSPATSSKPDRKTIKAKTVTLMRHVAAKLRVRSPSKKDIAACREQSASAAAAIAEARGESESDFYEDSDDEYAAAAEFLKQQAHSKEKVSQWLTLTFDGKPFDDVADVPELGLIESEPLATAMVSPTMTMSVPARSMEETVLTSVPDSHVNVSSSAGKADDRREFSVFSPISTFSPFDASQYASSGDCSDQDASANEHFANIETVKLRKPIVPVRMVSIRKKAKGFKASPSSSFSARAFHGGLIGASRSPSMGNGPVVNDWTSSLSRTVNANLTPSFSQRQREFLHRKYHQNQGKGAKPSSNGHGGGLFR